MTVCRQLGAGEYDAGDNRMTPAERSTEQIRRLAWIDQQIAKAKSMSDDPLSSEQERKWLAHYLRCGYDAIEQIERHLSRSDPAR
jgi:hypothetical protein